MTDLFSEEQLYNYTYSKKSHFDIFKHEKSDIKLFGKNLNIDEDADLNSYQNLLVYTFLKNKKGLKVLQIGTNDLISFEKLKDLHQCWKIDIDNITKKNIEFDFNIISENGNASISNPKAYFDFIFFPSSLNPQPDDINIFSDLLSNIKYLLKNNGILLCSFTNIIINNKLWVDDIFHFFANEKKIINKIVSHSRINNDPDLFVLPENFYNKYWQVHTNKSYKEFGKAFCYNLFIENKDKIYPEDFYKFTYLKKSHKEFFTSNSYAGEFFGSSHEEYTLDDYRNLLVYTFVKCNCKKGDRILQIGNASARLENLFKTDYDLFKLEDVSLLKKNCNFDDKILNLNNKEDLKEKNYKNFFDFSYSVSDIDDSEGNIGKYLSMINNIDRIMTLGGLTLFSFKSEVLVKKLKHPNLLSFLFDNNVFKLNKFVKDAIVIPDNNLYYSKKLLTQENSSEKNAAIEIKETVYSIVWKKIHFLPVSCKTKYNNRLKENPIYIFHHLMKCGGTSLFSILDKWFKTIDDNILTEDLNVYVLKKYNADIFHNDVCLRAHFQRAGIYLHERYPELLNKKDECRIFTFIRNPLSIRVSKYYFLKSMNAIGENIKLTDEILKESNFIANLLPCNESNYKEIIDRYFFIGIVEKLQESFDLFADLIGKKREKIPFLNISEKDSQINDLTPQYLKKFKERHELDYKIYEYCLGKFNNYTR